MGLLDDAIREHMELKRLRGADPGEVARQERDALGPVVREHEDESPNPAQDDLGNADPAHGNGTHGDSDLSMDPHPERGPDFANVGQETAELDMRTVLDEQLGEDALEQEPAILGETPGQERLWFDQQQQAPRDFDFDP
jgi:hypothetical protein